MKFCKYIIVFVLLFFYCHNPHLSVLGGVGIIKLYYILPLILLIFKLSDLLKIVTDFKSEISLLLLLIFITVLITGYGGDSSFFSLYLFSIFEILIIPCCIVLIFYYCGFSSPEAMVRILLIMGAIASVISTACIVSPGIKVAVDKLVVIDEESYLANVSFRGFGISDSLTFAYGIIQGVILSIGCSYLKFNKWFIFFIPLVLLSIFLNARIGLIIFVVGLMCYIWLKQSVKLLFKVTLSFFCIGALFLLCIPVLGLSDDSISFVEETFTILSSLFSSSSSDSAEVDLWRSMFQFPKGREWFLGAGTLEGFNSDIGFIRELKYGGIIFVTVLFSLIITLVRKMLYYHVPVYFIWLFIITLVIANMKGDFLINSGGFRLMMFVYIYLLEYKKCEYRQNVKI